MSPGFLGTCRDMQAFATHSVEQLRIKGVQGAKLFETQLETGNQQMALAFNKEQFCNNSLGVVK